SQVAFHTLVSLSDVDQIPAFRTAALRESPLVQTQFEQPIAADAPRFGFPFKAIEGEPPRLVLTGVNPGSPAERSGLKTGDVLVSVDGEPIADAVRFRLRLLAAAGETSLVVEREGEEEPLEIKVTPLGNPVRVGITWRMDDGEPGTALVTRVVFGSAAQAAGLQLKDRIYSVGGQPFASQQDLSRLLNETPSPVELLIERSGKLQTARLDVLDLGLPAAE
ncbi:MAG TPA: PDZ domain-containing protein, partial [Pirellulaceae bacterium]|nr:PDZ domain-containing protein [Pirellulaceae bacterium]